MNRSLVKILTVMLGVAAGVCVLASTVIASDAKNNTFRIAPITSQPLGKTYGEWAVSWWQWVLGAPTDTSPVTGSGNCEDRQSGKVWFLVGSFLGPDLTKRTCTIPEGKSLLIPLINKGYFAWPSDPIEQQTTEFVRSLTLCQEKQEKVVIEAFIDDVPVKNETRYYEQSPFFSVQVAPDNPWNVSGKDLVWYPGADSGYYLFLWPLEPGKHEIKWKALWTCGKDAKGNDIIFNQQAIHYDIFVLHD
jgi:hypothetical protein